MRSIEKRTTKNPASQSLCKLLDTFVEHGPNGTHRCLVLELLGPSLKVILNFYKEKKKHLRFETILKLSKQLLRAVAMIHKAGYGHGGMSLTVFVVQLAWLIYLALNL